MTVRDVLDYFAKCPDCGYPAQASATVRELRDGRVETEVRPSCGGGGGGGGGGPKKKKRNGRGGGGGQGPDPPPRGRGAGGRA
ncbi:hypothetical protein, partial [Nocardia abscessus]|uniref:hypothetical protein n=1 Tax=Nocardia abscessus TaxID=120957 RepID=UPI002458220A